jgi:hypothetical protein
MPMAKKFHSANYADDLAGLNDNIQKLIDIGIAGINLENAKAKRYT